MNLITLFSRESAFFTFSSVTVFSLIFEESMSSRTLQKGASVTWQLLSCFAENEYSTRLQETRVFPRLRMFSTRLTVAEEPRGRALYGLARSPPLTSQPSRIIPPFLLLLPPSPPSPPVNFDSLQQKRSPLSPFKYTTPQSCRP